MTNLSGKKALVTGASGGIGEAIAIALDAALYPPKVSIWDLVATIVGP